jgi:hypothetical protein
VKKATGGLVVAALLLAGCSLDFLRGLTGAGGALVAPGNLPLDSQGTPAPAATATAQPAGTDAGQIPAAKGTPTPTPRPTPTPINPAVLSSHVYGIVLSPEGKAAINAKVTAYLTNSQPLVSDNAASLISDGASNLISDGGSKYRILAISATTDEAGQFLIQLAATGSYNVEAVLSDELKAWKKSVDFPVPAVVDAGTLLASRTGRIRGRIKPKDPNATNLAGTQVFVPGSSYVAVTDAEGNYEIPNVAPGVFVVAAYNPNLGLGKTEPQQAPVEVKSEQVASAPEVVVIPLEPAITAIRIASASESTDNAAPGTAIDLVGKDFGFARGAKFEVQFAGATASVAATKAQRLSDELIRVQVPVGAQNGDIVVVTGGGRSAGKPIRILKAFTLTKASETIVTALPFDLRYYVQARDTADADVAEETFGLEIRKHRPNIAWSTDSALIRISPAGVVTVLGAGTAVVTGTAGSLPPRSITLTIQAI